MNDIPQNPLVIPVLRLRFKNFNFFTEAYIKTPLLIRLPRSILTLRYLTIICHGPYYIYICHGQNSLILIYKREIDAVTPVIAPHYVGAPVSLVLLTCPYLELGGNSLERLRTLLAYNL